MMLASLVATAGAQPASAPTDVTRALPSTFYLVTRQCKQSVIEIGSSLEKPGGDLVVQTEATLFFMACKKAKATPNSVACVLHTAQTLASSGKNSIPFDFSAYRYGGGPLVLQELLSGAAVYINPESGDAVTVSRQYVARDGFTHAFVKTCKALLLNERQFAEFAKSAD